MSSIKRTIVVLCVVLVAVYGIAANPLEDALKPKHQDIAKPSNYDEDRLPIGPDGSLFLAGTDCGPDEVHSPGMLPTCEPTCNNPKPLCPKIFYSGLDYVPCFCKAPLVRNEQTKQCVPLSDCPPKTMTPQQIRW